MANSPTSNSYCKSKTKPRRSGQGVWRGVDGMFGMRDGWHTIPVKLLSQLWLSFGLPCSTNSSMGFSRNKRTRFRLHVLDSGTARTGQFKSVDPRYEQRIEGHKLGLSEFWHDRGERRPISSGDSMAYEYAIRGCLGFGLTLHAAQASSRYRLHRSTGVREHFCEHVQVSVTLFS